MKKLLIASALFISSSCFAGSHGTYVLNCTSESLRTHLSMELNDYDFAEKALIPQKIIMSVMGSMSVFDEKMGHEFVTVNKNGLLEIYSKDTSRSHIFEVDFRKKSTATVMIKKALNPRTWKSFSGLSLTCQKSHNL